MRILAGLLLLAAACAPIERDGGSGAELAGMLAGRVPGATERCIPASMQGPIAIASSRTLTDRRGDTIWVNRQERDCFGDGPPATLIVEQQGGHHCRGDRVRALEPGSSIPGPVCLLRDWLPYRRAS